MRAKVPSVEFVSNTVVDVDVDLTLTATGPAVHSATNSHIATAPGVFMGTHFNGDSRPAQAVGSVRDPRIDFTFGQPSTQAAIESAETGDVFVQHN